MWSLPLSKDFPVVQIVKNLPMMQETRVQSLGWEDPLEKGMTIRSSILAWRIPWTEEPGGLQSRGSQRVGHDCSDLVCTPPYAWTGHKMTMVLNQIVWKIVSLFFLLVCINRYFSIYIHVNIKGCPICLRYKAELLPDTKMVNMYSYHFGVVAHFT